MKTVPLPEFMEKGSKGAFVDEVLKMLAVWHSCTFEAPHGIVLDKEYGDTGVAVMKLFQESVPGLDADGGFGPKTRAEFERCFGISMEDLAAQCCNKGATIFVQPGGESKSWTYDCSSGH